MNRRVRIGVDARELLGNTTGVGRYLGELLRRWTVRPDASSREFVLYAPEPLIGFEARVLPGGRGTWWEQTSLRRAARSDRLDAFFAPAYTAPVGLGVPLAVTIHDISFIAHPEWFRPRERWRRRMLTAYAARNASVVFTDSEFSRSEIEKHLRVERGSLVVIPPGVSPPPRRESGAASREPLVLFVGSLFNRRRLPTLIAAFARASRPIAGARLVIVGANRTWPRQDLRTIAARHGVAKQVEIREYVDEAALADLYARASVFAFLSEYEGFGLTPLEALASGIPIVVLDTPIAREVYAPAAAYVGHDVESVAEAIAQFLLSPAAAEEQLSHAGNVLSRYSWDRAADATLQQLDRIAGL